MKIKVNIQENPAGSKVDDDLKAGNINHIKEK